jgi:hypothetical protein
MKREDETPFEKKGADQAETVSAPFSLTGVIHD